MIVTASPSVAKPSVASVMCTQVSSTKASDFHVISTSSTGEVSQPNRKCWREESASLTRPYHDLKIAFEQFLKTQFTPAYPTHHSPFHWPPSYLIGNLYLITVICSYLVCPAGSAVFQPIPSLTNLLVGAAMAVPVIHLPHQLSHLRFARLLGTITATPTIHLLVRCLPYLTFAQLVGVITAVFMACH